MFFLALLSKFRLSVVLWLLFSNWIVNFSKYRKTQKKKQNKTKQKNKQNTYFHFQGGAGNFFKFIIPSFTRHSEDIGCKTPAGSYYCCMVHLSIWLRSCRTFRMLLDLLLLDWENTITFLSVLKELHLTVIIIIIIIIILIITNNNNNN